MVWLQCPWEFARGVASGQGHKQVLGNMAPQSGIWQVWRETRDLTWWVGGNRRMGSWSPCSNQWWVGVEPSVG